MIETLITERRKPLISKVQTVAKGGFSKAKTAFEILI